MTTITADWREALLDERQQKETAFAETYTREYNHGTTSHNQLILIARLAELLDAATGVNDLPPPPEPADIVLTFGKHSGKTLGELRALDEGYLEWLAREARDETIRRAANTVLAQSSPLLADDSDDDPFL